jgi:hypothetical protein
MHARRDRFDAAIAQMVVSDRSGATAPHRADRLQPLGEVEQRTIRPVPADEPVERGGLGAGRGGSSPVGPAESVPHANNLTHCVKHFS